MLMEEAKSSNREYCRWYYFCLANIVVSLPIAPLPVGGLYYTIPGSTGLMCLSLANVMYTAVSLASTS